MLFLSLRPRNFLDLVKGLDRFTLLFKLRLGFALSFLHAPKGNWVSAPLARHMQHAYKRDPVHSVVLMAWAEIPTPGATFCKRKRDLTFAAVHS